MPLPERPHNHRLAWTNLRFPAAYSIAAGHLVAVIFALLIGIVSSVALQSALRSRERVEHIYAHELLEMERLWSLTLQRVAQARAYLLSGNPIRLDESDAARQAFTKHLNRFIEQSDSPSERERLERIARAADEHHAAISRVIALYRAGGTREDVAELFEAGPVPKLAAVETAIAYATLEVHTRLEIARQDAQQSATRAIRLVILVVAFTVVLIASLGLLYLRTMQRIRRGLEENVTLLNREQSAREIAEEARQQLTETVSRLKEINAELDAFTGRIAHDLRNLLMPISLAPARLRKAKDEETRERIHVALERSISRANATLEGLLAFSRSGHSVDEFHPASVRETIREINEDLAPMAMAAQATVHTHLDDLTVACSAELLRVVMHNLLGNALKFIAQSVERQVWIRAHGSSGGVEIECTDTGPGIPSDAIPRIFEPFYRVPGSSAPGSGIGLATVQRIVIAHYGHIDCVSEIGKGTSFRVWLPEAK